ncbi:MAG: hypothetical protein PHV39_05450 [Methanomicrobium sp.]|nr:hypothetical protein [Methanomicrobium sp.]
MTFSFADKEENRLYLVLSPAARLRERNIELIKTYAGSDYYVLVVTTNQISEILKKNYQNHKIPMEKIYFIDTITKYASGNNKQSSENCLFINNPGNMTDMGIAITETLKFFKGKKACLIFDSINSSLIYSSSESLIKFIHFLANKLRIMECTGIFLAADTGLDPDLLTTLTLFVDNVIDANFYSGELFI